MRNISTTMLNAFVGKHILQLCPNQYNPRSNCAHFVGHALGIAVGVNCNNVAPAGKVHPGVSIRVDEIFNRWCPEKGKWSSKPAALHECLFFISIPSNVVYPPLIMGNDDTKHIGIYYNGLVWHYSNTMKKVVVVTAHQMNNHYPGQTQDWLFYGTFGP